MTGHSNPQSVPARSSNQQLPVRDPQSPPPQNHGSVSPPSKRDLTSWWKQFKRNAKKEEEKAVHYPGIFGVPLNVSIKYANVAISLTDDKGDSFIYGYVPIVVAKCGVYLKEKATDVEGIFRLSGSAKRIKDLQEVFNSPDRYGKGLDWTGYTVHDAANILRRYLNQLPEPIVPLDFYDRFRDPLRGHQSRSEGDTEAQASEPVDFDHDHAVVTYQKLIKELPSLNRQLLLYILDLLAVFSSKSEQNRMTSANLAAIFQPGLLSHPSHDMAPEEYRLSQDVLIFLIENQDNFLFGMTGTAADEQTVKELESGTIRPPTSRSNLRRSASNASAGADSLRKYETIRRNVSVSSKHSNSGNVPSPGTPNSVTGVQRSNTVPSKRPVKVSSPRFDKSAEVASPTSNSLAPPAESYGSSQSGSRTPAQKPDPATNASATGSGSLLSTPVSAYQSQPQAPTGTETANSATTTGPSSSGETASSQNPQSRVSSPQPMVTPTKERKISNFFTKSPPGDHERNEVRQPNKLRKKQRIPGSASESAQSSTNSLQGSNADLPAATSASHMPWARSEIGDGSNPDCSYTSTPKVSSSAAFGEEVTPQPNRETKTSSTSESNAQLSSDNTLKVNRSRTPSLNSRSSVTDQSDMDQVDEKKENRRSWRFHRRSKKSSDQFALALATSPPQLGVNSGAEFSSSSIGSSNRPTKNLTNDSQQPGTDTSGSGLAISMVPQEPHVGGNNHNHNAKPDNTKEPIAPLSEPEKKSFFGKFKARVAQVKDGVKDRDDKERAKSPPPQSEVDKAVSAPNLAIATKDNRPSRDASVDSIGESRVANHEPASAAAAAPSYTSTPASAPAAAPSVIPEEPSLESTDPEPAPQPETKPNTIPEEPAETETAQEQTPVVSVTPAMASTDVEPPLSPPSTVVEVTSSTTQEPPDSTPVVSQQVQNTS